MRDYIEIGPCLTHETCVQVGTENYHQRAREECKRFIKLLRETFGEEPFGAEIRIKSNPHDFGSYLDVVCYFDSEIEEAAQYAFKLENECPEYWSE